MKEKVEQEERIMKLTGEDAKAFKEYDSKPLSKEEIESLKKAKDVYRKYSKKQSEELF
jgi:hypothetical protein